MRRVFKYHLDVIQGAQSLELPKDPKLLHARVEDTSERIYLWYEVETEERPMLRRFEVFPTGVDVRGDHLVTVSTSGLGLLWHVYEIWVDRE